MESDHERSISILQNQLQTSQQEIHQLKTRIDLLEQTNINKEKLISNPDTSQIGINNHSNRDDTLAWSDSQRHYKEVKILSIVFILIISFYNFLGHINKNIFLFPTIFSPYVIKKPFNGTSFRYVVMSCNYFAS